MKASKLTKKSDFQKVRAGKIAKSPSLLVQSVPGVARETRVGFIISKKVGNAVMRNFVRRRLRTALLAGADVCKVGWDYVVVAHPSLAGKKYDRLQSELLAALKKLNQS